VVHEEEILLPISGSQPNVLEHIHGTVWLVLLMQLFELQNKMFYPKHEGVHFFPDVLVRQIGAII
jgi:hypothetical protein